LAEVGRICPKSNRPFRSRVAGLRSRSNFGSHNLSKIIYKKSGGEHNSTKTITAFYKQAKIGRTIHNHYAIHYATSLAIITTFNSI